MLIPGVAFYHENQTYDLDVNCPLGWLLSRYSLVVDLLRCNGLSVPRGEHILRYGDILLLTFHQSYVRKIYSIYLVK